MAEGECIALPQKKFYRQRAHANPISDHDIEYSSSPELMNWTPLFAGFISQYREEHKIDPDVEFLDVGCGYGGLLVTLSPLFPNKLILGLEIRLQVCDYVQKRIEALRQMHPGQYQNIACMRTNAMKYLPNMFRKHQLSKMFILYPDPHFKKAKHKWRIISPALLAEYAYILKPNGILYTVTDVEEMHLWIIKHCGEHPLFKRLQDSDLYDDPVVQKLFESTEEGMKVSRNEGQKFLAVFRRVQDPYSCTAFSE